MSHGKTICKYCQAVIRQCRCMDHGGLQNVTTSVCEDCFSRAEEEREPKEKDPDE